MNNDHPFNEQSTFHAVGALSEQDRAAVDQLRGASITEVPSEALVRNDNPDVSDVQFREIKAPTRKVTIYDWINAPTHELKIIRDRLRKKLDKLKSDKAYAMSISHSANSMLGRSAHHSLLTEYENLNNEYRSVVQLLQNRKNADQK